jgi:4-carboxymuconolactone decarboxylase
VRLPQLDLASLSAEQRALYDEIVGARGGDSLRSRNVTDAEGRIQGPFNHMLLAPTVGAPLQRLGGVLRFRGTLPDRARELVILVVAQAWASEFEWFAHARIGGEVGLTDAEIDAVRAGRVPPLADPAERAAAGMARALVDRGDLTDDEHAAAGAALDPAAIVEVTTLVGYYAMLALQMRVFRVALPDGAEPAFGSG